LWRDSRWRRQWLCDGNVETGVVNVWGKKNSRWVEDLCNGDENNKNKRDYREEGEGKQREKEIEINRK